MTRNEPIPKIRSSIDSTRPSWTGRVSKSLLPLLKQDIALPTYSLICKRAPELGAHLPKLSKRRPRVIMLDATGIKVAACGYYKRAVARLA